MPDQILPLHTGVILEPHQSAHRHRPCLRGELMLRQAQLFTMFSTFLFH